MKRRLIMGFAVLFAAASFGMGPAAAQEPESEYEDWDESEDEYWDETEYEYWDEYDETETEEEVIPMPVYNVSDYLVITDDAYRDITVQVSPAKQVTEEEIQAEIEDAFYYLSNYDELIIKQTEGTVSEGDTVNIDYVGTKDGEAFDGGTAENQDLTIGSDSFIDGFEDGLVGKEVGGTYDLELTFPEDYGVEDLNGADVVFSVTVNYIAQIPELTDEIAEELSGGEYPTADSYTESVRADLQASYDEEYRSEAYGAIMTSLSELYPLEEYPEENIGYYMDMIISEYIEPYASMYGMDLDEFISMAYEGLTLEELKEQQLRPSAQQFVQQEILLGAVAEKEGITMTDDELMEILQGYADEYGMTIEDITAGEDLEYLKVNERNQKVMEWLFENVTIEQVSETEADAEQTEA